MDPFAESPEKENPQLARADLVSRNAKLLTNYTKRKNPVEVGEMPYTIQLTRSGVKCNGLDCQTLNGYGTSEG